MLRDEIVISGAAGCRATQRCENAPRSGSGRPAGYVAVPLEGDKPPGGRVLGEHICRERHEHEVLDSTRRLDDGAVGLEP